MKRFVTLMLAAGLMLGAHTAAQAATVKASGVWDFAFQHSNMQNYPASVTNQTTDGYFGATQRLRLQVDIIATEDLSGVVYFEMGDTNWGNANQGGALGADGKVVELRRSYIDWVIPQTIMKVRMGIQGLALPGIPFGSAIMNDDVAGITMSAKFNPNMAATLFWARPYNNGPANRWKGDPNNRFDEMDLAGLIVPLTYDGVKLVPWLMGGLLGDDTLLAGNGGSVKTVTNGLLPFGAKPGTPMRGTADGDYARMWWAGLTGDVTLLDPFRFAFDMNYGSQGGWVEELSRKGWLVTGLAEYKTGTMWGNPGLLAWYGSGDDDDNSNGSERMPFIAPMGDYTLTSMGFTGAGGVTNEGLVGRNPAGTWGIGLQVTKISFVDDLSHVIRVAYLRGTNDESMGSNKGTAFKSGEGLYLTDKDKVVEINFDSTYKIYENLSLIAEMGYMFIDMDQDVWNYSQKSDAPNAWRAGMSLSYTF